MRIINPLIIFVFLSTSVLAQSKTVHFKVIGKSGQLSEKMTVSQNSSETAVEFFDTAGESSLNIFSQDMKAVESKYFDINRKEYMKIKFDRQSGFKNGSRDHAASAKIISEGAVNKTYNLEDPVYDGNGALFLVFSQILPEKNRVFIFNLLQSKEKRIVKMYLKYVGSEKITVAGKPVETLKYETGLVSRVLSFFWPYKYNYWFDASTHEFLRYEGPVDHKDSEIIEVNLR